MILDGIWGGNASREKPFTMFAYAYIHHALLMYGLWSFRVTCKVLPLVYSYTILNKINPCLIVQYKEICNAGAVKPNL